MDGVTNESFRDKGIGQRKISIRRVGESSKAIFGGHPKQSVVRGAERA